MPRGRGGQRGGPKKGRRPAMHMAPEDMNDEIDDFRLTRDPGLFSPVMETRNKVDLDQGGADGDSDDEIQPVMDLSVDTSDDGDDEDDTQAQEVDFDDDEDDEDDDAADGDALRANWGKRKKTYYGQEDEEEAEFDSDEEAAINEEQEVKRLQKKRAEERSDADFDSLGELISQAKAKSSKVSASNDLRAFTMDIDVSAAERVSRDVSGLSKQERLDIIAKDSPELFALLESLRDKIAEVKDRVHPLVEQVRDKKMKTNNGLSYLEVKFHLLLNYCVNICFYLMLKADGKSVKGHPVIEQLVKTRLTLDKMRPLDQKLKYQIDKLIKMAALGASNLDVDEKLKHKPNLRAFQPIEGDDDADEKVDKSKQLYRAPKISATKYEDENDKRLRRQEKNVKKSSNSLMAQFIRDEYGQEPESRPGVGRDLAPEQDVDDIERREWEEDNMQRKLLTKKEMKKRKRMVLPNDLAELEDFSDLAAFDRAEYSAAAMADIDDDDEGAADDSAPIKGSKKSQMASILNTIDQATKSSLKKKASADQDLPYKELSKVTKKAKLNDDDEFVSFKGKKGGLLESRFAKDDNDDDGVDIGADDFNGSDDDDGMDMEEDDVYKAAEAALAARREGKAAKQDARRQLSQEELYEGGVDVADGKRGIDRTIAKNIGLTKKVGKKKQIRNPRVKQKVKYENALKRRAGQVQTMRSTAKPYSGEASGVKSNLVRSTKLG